MTQINTLITRPCDEIKAAHVPKNYIALLFKKQ